MVHDRMAEGEYPPLACERANEGRQLSNLSFPDLQVVVCIVSDGRAKINPRTLAVIQKLGCYQPGQAKNVSHPASPPPASFAPSHLTLST